MIKVSGIDVGTSTIKIVHLEYGAEGCKILGTGLYEVGNARIKTLAREAYEDSISSFGLDKMDYIAATGSGKDMVSFAHRSFYDITAHARGAHYLYPNTRSVLDVGFYNAKAMNINERAKVMQFKYNDKCAAGSGKFLESVADALDLELEDMGDLSNKSTEPLKVSSVCAVYAETEIINLKTAKHKREDIVKAVHDSIAERLVVLLEHINSQSELTITGGVSKNGGMVNSIGERLRGAGRELKINVDSEYSTYAGALGAALWGGYRYFSGKTA